MNSDALKDFLFRHVEKFIFAALVLLAVFLVYRGFQMPDYLSQQQPDRMEQSAQEVRVSIDGDHWEQIAPERVETIDVVARTNESIRPVDPEVYRLSHPWEAKSIDMSIKREDPAIAAPIELRVSGMVAALAYKSSNPEYPLLALENADAVEKKEPEPQRPQRNRRRGMSPEEMMMAEEAMMAEEMMMADAGAGMADGMMMGSGMAGPSRRIDARKYDQGFRPQGATTNLVPAMGHFIAGVGLMPHKQLVTAFEEALQQADGYDARRDQPTYLLFELYRADVTEKSVDQLTDQDWVVRGNSEFYKRLVIRQWAGMAKEIVTGKYRDPVLTTPIPPVLLTHYGSFASHPKIPLGDEDPQARLRQQQPQEQLPSGPITFDAEEDPFANRNQFAPGGRGMRSPAMGGGMGPGAMGRGAMMSVGPFGSRQNIDHPEYKLIRFYDFRDFSGSDRSAPQPGRKYVYRIRVAIEDPNFPEEPAAQPRSSTLSAEVFRRVEREAANATRTNRRISRRWSEFSEPSPAVSLPPTTAAYAGPVVPATIRKMQVEGREVEFTQRPATGKLVVAQWHRTYQVPVPVFMDVLRGSVVAKKGDFEVPDPLSLAIKKLPDAEINTQTVVVDVGGGNPLAISAAENQTEPAVMLLFDASGGLRVVDEVQSQHGYRLYSFADERGE